MPYLCPGRKVAKEETTLDKPGDMLSSLFWERVPKPVLTRSYIELAQCPVFIDLLF